MRASFPCLLVCSEEHFMSAVSEFKVMSAGIHVPCREGARCEALHTASQLQTVLYTGWEAAAGAASLVGQKFALVDQPHKPLPKDSQ